MTTWELAMAAMLEDENMRSGEVARIEQADAEAYRYLGPMNPLKHLLPDVVAAEKNAANKAIQESRR
jgi:hypothetical protein